MRIEDLSLWEAFHWVAREKSFTKAAAAMRIGTPVLSKKVARLEDQLGVRLFQRSTRKVSLTEEGRGLHPHVESLLSDARNLVSRFEDVDHLDGTIRLSAPSSVGQRFLAALLVKFQTLHPDVRFEVDVNDKLIDLISAQIDLALRISHAPNDSDYVWWKLATNPLVFCASPSYLKKHGKPPKKPTDLKQHCLLSAKVFENIRLKNSDFRIRDFAMSNSIESNSGMFLTQLASEGAGVTVRSKWAISEELESGRLVQVMPKYSPEDYGSIYAVAPSRRLMSRRLRTFLDFLLMESKTWNQN